jgi:adenylyltransferase/sulfurtransferase
MIVTPEEFQQIVAQAEREYPNECCGAVLVKDGSPEERVFLLCRNIQDELHEKEPDRYPRTARTAYHVGPDDSRAIDDKVGTGYRPIIYHSHVDAGAYFSETDKRIALFQGEPLYPHAIYLVVSVLQGKAADANAFAWDPEHRDFRSIPFQAP